MRLVYRTGARRFYTPETEPGGGLVEWFRRALREDGPAAFWRGSFAASLRPALGLVAAPAWADELRLAPERHAPDVAAQ